MILLRPRWLAWHAFAVVAFAGMLYLGDWQLRRALSGNELSWAYTFEWPLFAVCGGYFWVRSLREELQAHKPAGEVGEVGPDPAAGSGAATGPDPASGSGTGASARQEAYVARLQAEVRGHGKWHGWR